MNKEKKKADEDEKFIDGERIKIEKERIECEKMAEDAERELAKAMPALERAEEALAKLEKEHITEVKSYKTPKKEIAEVMFAVMVLLKKEPTWPRVQKELANPEFTKWVKEFDKDSVSQKTLTAIEKYTKKEFFDPDFMLRKSQAAGVLCLWVRSMEDYSKALKIVRPKRARKEHAEA